MNNDDREHSTVQVISLKESKELINILINPNDTDFKIATQIRAAIRLSEGEEFTVKLKPLGF